MRRPSHATLVAYLALFIALGGTSYAALKVTGRNVVDGSLSGRDIGQGTLTSRHIRDGSVRLKDLSAAAVQTGATGPAGPAGAAGPAGPKGDKGDKGDPPTTAFAIVNSDGTLRNGRGVEVTDIADPVAGGPGYVVGFAQDVTQCALNISVIDTTKVNDYQQIPPGTAGAIFIIDNAYPNYLPEVESAIMARITDASGAVIRSPFQVSVIC